MTTAQFLERSARRAVLRAPAKLNLYLDVLFKRADGYHELESVMQAVDLCDVLEVERAEGSAIAFEVAGRECPIDGSNLVVRAAESAFSRLKRRFGLKVLLRKNIPLGAGLGGGSADAAAMLRAVNHFAEDALSAADLAALAGGLGSDVPFFLTGGTAIARGRGERIEPLDSSRIRTQTYCVLFPGVHVPTPRIYGFLNLVLTEPKGDLRNFVSALDRTGSDALPAFHNSLAVPFRNLYPELAALQDRASAAVGHEFHVTGSGSAMFAAVRDRADGADVVRQLQAMAAGELFVCESLPAWQAGA